MRIPKKELQPGEWQVETTPYGGTRRYRMLGNGCKEYEPTITIGGIEIPQSELDTFHANRKAAEEARKKAEREAAAREVQRRACPFADGIKDDCRHEQCALYVNGCALARLTDKLPATDTKGKKCPINHYGRACRDDCALYESGCKIVALITDKGDKNE